MPAGRLRAALSGISLTRALVALGAVLVAINVGQAIWDIRADRQRVQQRAQRDFSNLTRLLAEQTAASLEAVDLVLRDAGRDGSSAKTAEAPRPMPEELAPVAPPASNLPTGRGVPCPSRGRPSGGPRGGAPPRRSS